jgi:predicted translin family RNA/ssDNA-binding protein
LKSIKICKEFVTELSQILLEFDFRNGPLRRKYDSLKYSLKTIEDIHYEMTISQQSMATGQLFSLTSLPVQQSTVETMGEDISGSKPPPSKKPRLSPPQSTIITSSDTSATVDSNEKQVETSNFRRLLESEFRAINQRMTDYDQLRESVIKESRDIQKMAKQAIFAVIRNQLGDAKQKLQKSLQKAEKLYTDIIQKVTTIICLYCSNRFAYFISIPLYDKVPIRMR